MILPLEVQRLLATPSLQVIEALATDVFIAPNVRPPSTRRAQVFPHLHERNQYQFVHSAKT